jgi:release factor glutamine methyltransferase
VTSLNNNTPVTLAACLRNAPLDTLENRILICHALGLSRIQLITQTERIISAEEQVRLHALFERRLAGEPIAYIVGEREFFGLNLAVTPAVLIPRPDTELLVELALTHLPDNGTMLDLGTGSGAIAIAVAHTRADARVTAVDISTDALVIAQLNATRHLNNSTGQCSLLQSNWYQGLNHSRFDLIVSNPPYIVEGDHHLSEGDLRFEPINALTDHADGLTAYRTIINDAGRHLNKHGWLLMEHGYDQAEAVRALLAQAGFDAIESWKDLAGIERVSGGYLSLCT